jgi:hypothetical protein
LEWAKTWATRWISTSFCDIWRHWACTSRKLNLFGSIHPVLKTIKPYLCCCAWGSQTFYRCGHPRGCNNYKLSTILKYLFGIY